MVIGRKGSLGTVFYLERPFWPHDTTLWVKDFRGNNPYFCSLLLRTLDLGAFDAGSSNPTLNRNHAHLLQVRVPDRSLQDRIATVLSAFDELIEVNERRIEVLEDLARSLYQEWFVRFRFPGHGPISVDGAAPADWTTASFSAVARFVNGFAFKPSHHGGDGPPIIKIKELKQGVTSATPRSLLPELDTKYRVEPGDLLFSWSADLGVYRWSGEAGLLNQHLFRVVPSGQLSEEYLFHALQEAVPSFQSRAQGTTMRHIKRSALDEVECWVPDSELLLGFTECCRPLHHEGIALTHHNRALAATRDLLLPRLVTGGLDIEDIDLDALLSEPAEAA